MTTEQACRGEFAQTMSNHIVGDVNRDMAASVMNGDGMTNHLGEDCAGAGPGADDLFSPASFIFSTFFKSFGSMNGPFFNDRDISTYLS